MLFSNNKPGNAGWGQLFSGKNNWPPQVISIFREFIKRGSYWDAQPADRIKEIIQQMYLYYLNSCDPHYSAVFDPFTPMTLDNALGLNVGNILML